MAISIEMKIHITNDETENISSSATIYKWKSMYFAEDIEIYKITLKVDIYMYGSSDTYLFISVYASIFLLCPFPSCLFILDPPIFL